MTNHQNNIDTFYFEPNISSSKEVWGVLKESLLTLVMFLLSAFHYQDKLYFISAVFFIAFLVGMILILARIFSFRTRMATRKNGLFICINNSEFQIGLKHIDKIFSIDIKFIKEVKIAGKSGIYEIVFSELNNDLCILKPKLKRRATGEYALCITIYEVGDELQNEAFCKFLSELCVNK